MSRFIQSASLAAVVLTLFAVAGLFAGVAAPASGCCSGGDCFACCGDACELCCGDNCAECCGDACEACCGDACSDCCGADCCSEAVASAPAACNAATGCCAAK